jgi:hypothetical protein
MENVFDLNGTTRPKRIRIDLMNEKKENGPKNGCSVKFLM